MRVILVLLAVMLEGEAASGADMSSLSRQTFDEVNQYRRDAGLAPLRWSAAAANEARKHCMAVASGRRAMGHDGFDQRMAQLRKQVSLSSGAENIASLAPVGDLPSRAVDLWAGSRGHRRNMEGNYQVTGVGAAAARNGQVCVTQIFLGNN